MARKASSKTETQKEVEEPKTYKIRFETESGLPISFRDFGLEYTKNVKGDIITHTKLGQPFEIKNGETLELDEATYKYLKEKGAILSPVEKDARERLRRKKLRRKSVRAEPKKDFQTWNRETKNAVFNHLPFDVVDE
jgi:hypothetical protein